MFQLFMYFQYLPPSVSFIAVPVTSPAGNKNQAFSGFIYTAITSMVWPYFFFFLPLV